MTHHEAIKKAPKGKLRETFEAIGTALLLALVIRTFLFQAFKIPSGSMLETLQIGDHIIVNKIVYGTPVDIPFTAKNLFNTPALGDEPKHGDVIVFKFPQDPDRDFIKRVIGVPGDTIEIREKAVYRNGQPLQEPYVVHHDPQIRVGDRRDNLPSFTVPEGKYFMMGDNRDFSLDSRFWGFVDRKLIRGKALILYWSWDANADLMRKIRWSRIGSLVHS